MGGKRRIRAEDAKASSEVQYRPERVSDVTATQLVTGQVQRNPLLSGRTRGRESEGGQLLKVFFSFSHSFLEHIRKIQNGAVTDLTDLIAVPAHQSSASSFCRFKRELLPLPCPSFEKFFK